MKLGFLKKIGKWLLKEIIEEVVEKFIEKKKKEGD